MAGKKAKGNRVQVILECTEMKQSGLPGTVYNHKKPQEYSRPSGIEKIQPHTQTYDRS